MKHVPVVIFAALLLSACSSMDGGNSSGSMGNDPMGSGYGSSSGASRVGGAIANPATNPALSSDPRNIYFGD